MRLTMLLKSVLAVGVPVALLTGCDLLTNSDTPANDEAAWESSTDLTSEYGGYAFTDEADAFGDPTLKAIELEQPIVAAADSDTVATPRGMLVRVLWGQLEGNRDAETVVDWSGAFAVSSGRLAVLRLIAFERPGDRLLPRDSRQVVPFRSMTRPHFDGMLLLIHDDGSDPNATLTMDTGPLTASWTFEELRDMQRIIPVDDLGNAVSVASVQLPDDPACLNGIARGHWQARLGERGVFGGLWVTEYGRPVGHIRGHFGINDAGERVWFGKIIARGGRVIGLARGTYSPSEATDVPGGVFRGEWAARPGERSGVIEGRYIPARDGRHGAAGFFQAHWKQNCDTAPDGGGVDPMPASN